jgi:hypothetical protein
MPAGKVRQADIADLARPDEAVESLKGFFERSLAVPLVQLIEIDTVGAKPLEACLAGFDQMISRRRHRSAHPLSGSAPW